MMNTERGTIGRVVIRENPPQGIRIGDRVVEARHFTVRGGGGGQVWHGPNDAPVRFSFESHGHSVTFTMER